MGELSRRRFLKILGAGAVMTAVGAETNREHNLAKEGVTNQFATFIPLYERHETGIKPSDIPTGMEANPEEILDSTAYVFDSFDASKNGIKVRAFKPELINTLAKSGTEIMVGDVFVADLDIKTILPRVMFSAAALTAGSVLSFLTMLPSEKLKGNRKMFLGLTGLLTMAVAAHPFTKFLVDIGQDQTEPAKRILTRLGGLASNLHPEDLNTFTQNLIMSLKMLVTARQTNEKLGRKIKLAFNVQAGHSGIEDFLQLDEENCRRLLLAYPSDFLKELMNREGGVKNFSSSRLFKLSSETELQVISERFVVDTDLESSLQKI